MQSISFLAQLVERVTSNDEVSRSSRLEGIPVISLSLIQKYTRLFIAVFT